MGHLHELPLHTLQASPTKMVGSWKLDGDTADVRTAFGWSTESCPRCARAASVGGSGSVVAGPVAAAGLVSLATDE